MYLVLNALSFHIYKEKTKSHLEKSGYVNA